jgi:CheY-like chemotaxis protein
LGNSDGTLLACLKGNPSFSAADPPVFLLPICLMMDHQIRAEEPASSGTVNVLFVTTDADLRAVAERVLTREGYRVLTAAHAGHALLAGLKCERIDILITESNLDGAAGPVLAESLRRYHPAMRALYMADAGTARALGVVVRPFTRDDLLREIETLCCVTSPSAS